MDALLPWLSLGLLGAYHGVNPGMGWLFAVALGLQERRRWAVIRAMGPIAAGHAASVAVVVALLGAAQLWVDGAVLRALGGAALVAFGLYKLLRPLSHPRWVGMRVGPGDLAVWSFLMASAHGAGLMLVPLLLGQHAGGDDHTAHAASLAAAALQPVGSAAVQDVLAVLVHTVVMFAVMAAVALVVYERVGLKILRSAWLNLDRIWAGVLVLTGVLTIVI
ncbi:MAG: hypothetical protein U0893_05230 [Chloroflexota bacterium]